MGSGGGLAVLAGAGLFSCSLLVSTTDLSSPADGSEAGPGVGDATIATCDADTRSDLDNCGTCGNRCLTRANGFPECTLGACTNKCNVTFGDCDGNAANGCETSLNADAKHCGACGHDCGGAACIAGVCGPVKLTTTNLEPYALGADGTSIFFTTVKDGSAYRCDAVLGCLAAGATRIGVGNERSYYLGLDATHVYWNNNSTNNTASPGMMLGALKTGSSPPIIITKEPAASAANPTSVAVDDANVYFGSNEGTVWRWSKSGPVGAAPKPLTKVVSHAELAVANNQVYIASNNAVHVCSSSSCPSPPTRLVADDQPGLGGISADATAVFWTRDDGVFAYSLVAKVATAIAKTTGAGHVIVSGDEVIFTDPLSGRIAKMPKTGGTSQTLATEERNIAGFTVDAKFVYWINTKEGAIYKLAR
jgi:hypothetical protein